MAIGERIPVSVVYALADRQTIVTLRVPARSTVGDVIAASGLLRKFPKVPQPPKCAIFGRVAALTDQVQTGDRIEILRPLAVDPKEGRRRAAAQTRMRKPPTR